MTPRILHAWDRIRGSFWFLPALMALAAAALAFGVLALDRGAAGRWIAAHGLGYGGGAEGASTMLQTIASSMMTIAGVVFSMTLVALSLASSQFGSRLLRNFMRDTTNQVVLGVFVATFLYCILVLRAVRRADESLFVPEVAVAVGVGLAVASIAVLVFFIHHVATSIQADEVVARVGAEALDGIERLFPHPIGRPGGEVPGGAPRAHMPDCESRMIAAAGDGYLQRVDAEALLEVAAREDFVVRLCRRPGDYAVAGTAVAWAWPGERVDDGAAEELAGAFSLGAQRTPMQDVRFCLQQLVEIAVRALSPGVNDPFTALVAIDRIASTLYHLAGREMPETHRLDEGGQLRLIAIPTTFAEFVDAAFDPLRRHARGDAAVTIRLLEAVRTVAPATRRAADREALGRQAGMVARAASEALSEPEDRHRARQAFEAAIESLQPRKLIPLHAS